MALAKHADNLSLDCVSKDITGQAIPVVRDLVGNLAEVFCLTDPSVHDNPIIFASEGKCNTFHISRELASNIVLERISQNHTIWNLIRHRSKLQILARPGYR